MFAPVCNLYLFDTERGAFTVEAPTPYTATAMLGNDVGKVRRVFKSTRKGWAELTDADRGN